MRSIDHLVMPFETLAAARDWFESLGFLVAPDAAHPFGTGNACVFLADGRYIEPLAVIDAPARQAAADEGNLFVVRDAAGRKSSEPSAISALAFRSNDAAEDRAQLLAARVDEDDFVEFRRPMRLPDGGVTELSFRLAFAAMAAPDAPSFFFVEARHKLKPDRSSLVAHPNGAKGVTAVTLRAGKPAALQDYLAAIADSSAEFTDDGALTVPLDGGELEIFAGAGSLTIDSLTVAVRDLAVAKSLWQSRAVGYSDNGQSIAIACPNGHGTIRFIEDRP